MRGRLGNTAAWGFESVDVFLPWYFIQVSCVEVDCCLPTETNDSSAFFLSLQVLRMHHP